MNTEHSSFQESASLHRNIQSLFHELWNPWLRILSLLKTIRNKQLLRVLRFWEMCWLIWRTKSWKFQFWMQFENLFPISKAQKYLKFLSGVLESFQYQVKKPKNPLKFCCKILEAYPSNRQNQNKKKVKNRKPSQKQSFKRTDLIKLRLL